MIVARCPICGADHIECGGPSGSVPIDIPEPEERMPRSRKMVQVQIRPGYTVKMDETSAKAYVKSHPTAKLVQDKPVPKPEPEPEQVEELESKHVEEPAEDKQVARQQTKSRKKSE